MGAKKITRSKLPRDIQQQCLWIVRGYDRSRKEYKERREEILAGGGERFTTYFVDGEERREYISGSHNASRTTENIEMQLEGLEQMPAFRQMHAVEHALERIGSGLPELLRDMMKKAVLLNCMNGRKYPFERLYTVGISRRGFYRYREAFFYDIANELGLF